MSDCEWNPIAKRPAFEHDAPHAEAVWAVGVDGRWHLCDGCAALPEFARYRKRRKLFRRAPPRVKRRANRAGKCGHLSPTAEFGCSRAKGHKGPHQEIGVSETLGNPSGTWTDAECHACVECGCRIASPGLCGECSSEDDCAIW